MGYLITAALFIVVGSFCLVYGLDRTRPVKTRKYLLLMALICLIIVLGLATAIMKNPLR